MSKLISSSNCVIRHAVLWTLSNIRMPPRQICKRVVVLFWVGGTLQISAIDCELPCSWRLHHITNIVYAGITTTKHCTVKRIPLPESCKWVALQTEITRSPCGNGSQRFAQSRMHRHSRQMQESLRDKDSLHLSHVVTMLYGCVTCAWCNCCKIVLYYIRYYCRGVPSVMPWFANSAWSNKAACFEDLCEVTALKVSQDSTAFIWLHFSFFPTLHTLRSDCIVASCVLVETSWSITTSAGAVPLVF